MHIYPCNICPCDICPYQEYLSCHWPYFETSLASYYSFTLDNLRQLSYGHFSMQHLSLQHLSISGISQLSLAQFWPNFKGTVTVKLIWKIIFFPPKELSWVGIQKLFHQKIGHSFLRDWGTHWLLWFPILLFLILRARSEGVIWKMFDVTHFTASFLEIVPKLVF